MPNSIVIRDATAADMYAIQAIYAYEVLQGLATFEEVPPSVDDLLLRRDNVLNLGLPYLAAEQEGQVVGYSYATDFHQRPAYRNTVEDAVYVAQDQLGQGIGAALLSELIVRCEDGPWRQMVAVIGNTGNAGSIALHSRLGFHHVGTLQAVGFKFNQWVDAVLMQRALSTGRDTLPTTSSSMA